MAIQVHWEVAAIQAEAGRSVEAASRVEAVNWEAEIRVAEADSEAEEGLVVGAASAAEPAGQEVAAAEVAAEAGAAVGVEAASGAVAAVEAGEAEAAAAAGAEAEAEAAEAAEEEEEAATARLQAPARRARSGRSRALQPGRGKESPRGRQMHRRNASRALNARGVETDTGWIDQLPRISLASDGTLAQAT